MEGPEVQRLIDLIGNTEIKEEVLKIVHDFQLGGLGADVSEEKFVGLLTQMALYRIGVYISNREPLPKFPIGVIYSKILDMMNGNSRLMDNTTVTLVRGKKIIIEEATE